jgi:hypothetical protein
MKKQHIQVYILLGLALFTSILSGCGSSVKLTCPEPEQPLAAPAPGEERIPFTLQNDTCMSICVLLISPDHCEYMGGVNWVQDHPLPSGGSTTIELPAGRYAAWVELCTEEYRADEHLKVYDDYTHTITDPAAGSKPPCGTSLAIINNGDVPICNMRIGIGESVYTGWNWIGTEYIQPGDSREFILRPDTYFIRAEGCDGGWLRSEVDVKISGHQTWTVP